MIRRSSTLLLALLLTALAASAGAEVAHRPQAASGGPSPADRLHAAVLDEAARAVEEGDLLHAEDLYRSLTSAADPWTSWAGWSGLVATRRAAEDWDGARAATAEIAAARPELAALMALWDGDTARMAGETGRALAAYQRSAGGSVSGGVTVAGMAVAELALQQIARTHLAAGDPLASAAVERQLAAAARDRTGAESALARALVAEAMAAGDLPLLPISSLLHEGVCGLGRPCLIAGGRAFAGHRGGVELAGLGGLTFELTAEDRATLAAAESAAATAPAPEAPLACTPTTASNGFQYPMPNDHSGYVFMSSITEGYHPGLDINGPGSGDADCGTVFKSVAQGCVTDSSPADWGSATVQHSYNTRTWTSQYGHASTINYSAGSAISKGASLGTVGKVATGSCHLHHELREQDHPNPTNANYYSSLTKANVGDWYQNPFPFHDAHRSYLWYVWADENLFTYTGTWNTVTGVGDEDDMRWAYTTATGSKTTYARWGFTAPTSGTYDLWVFVPYDHATSTLAAWRLFQGTTTLFSKAINQSTLLDAWVKVGTSVLTGGVTYTVEVATNTGESSRKVGIDDILVLKTSNAI